MRRPALAFVVALAGGAAFGAFYEVDAGCRPGHVIHSNVGVLSMNDISFPAGSDLERSFIAAQDEDNGAAIGSFWHQDHNHYASPWVTGNNGTSEAAFVHFSQIGLPPNRGGWTFTWYADAWSWAHWCVYYDHIKEADVLLDADAVWDPSLQAKWDSNTPNEKAVAQHELLHSAGFDHQPFVVATMGAGATAFFGMGQDLPLLHADDKMGLRTLYGNGQHGADVAIQGWKVIDTITEYGHIGTVDQSPVVQQGQLAHSEITIENHGTDTVDTSLGIYGRFVGGSGGWQKLIAWTFQGLVSGATETHDLLIPTAGLAKGRWEIRMVVNDDGALADQNTLNNFYDSPQQLQIN
jgi:hypothetical protein